MTNYNTLVTDRENTLLNAATGTGAGANYAVPAMTGGGQFASFGWQTVVAGTFSAISVTLQGSLDGTHWSVLDTSTATAGEYKAVVNSPVLFIRANVGTFTGGTSVTVLLVAGR